jgi:hypothetical protein
MNPPQKLSKSLTIAFEHICERLNTLEMKVNVLAMQTGLIDFCDCREEPNDRVMIEGMPCCPICQMVIKKYITITELKK